MSAFIINLQASTVVGFVQNIAVAGEKGGEHLVINVSKDLEALSGQQLTDLYNALSPDAKITKFKISKDKAAEKVFSLITSLDMSTLVQLDKDEEKVVETKSEEIAAKEEVAAIVDGKKVRKIRDSKLQRMKAAFLSKDESDSFRPWTVKELMEKCGTTERITHVYISILRSPTDRFIMNIEKSGANEPDKTPTFVYKPKQTNVDAQPAA
jgi:hypothetical protein